MKILNKNTTKNNKIEKVIETNLISHPHTQEKLEKTQIIDNDIKRNKESQRVKSLIDIFYRIYIKNCLESIKNESFKTNKDGNIFNQIEHLYRNKEDKKLDDKLIILADIISKSFPKIKPTFPSIYKSHLIPMVDNMEESEKKEMAIILDSFSGRGVYFDSFTSIRNDIFSSELKSNTVVNRIINDNLFRFIDNIKHLEKISKKFSDIFHQTGNIFDNEDLKKLEKYTNGVKLKNIFSSESYSKFFTQEGIFSYNIFINGISLDEDTKLKGINEIINEYCHQNNLKNSKIGKFYELYKQILSDEDSDNNRYVKYTYTHELLSGISDLENFHSINISKVRDLFSTIDEYDISEIYLNDIRALSYHLFGKPDSVKDAILYKFDKDNEKRKSSKIFETERTRLSKIKEHSIQSINDSIELSIADGEITSSYKIDNIYSFISSFIDNTNANSIVADIAITSSLMKDVEFDNNSKILKPNAKKHVNGLMENYNRLKNFISILQCKKLDKNVSFYNEYDKLQKNYKKIILEVYNKCRNFATQRDVSEDKVRLFFDQPTLGKGFSEATVENGKSTNGTQYKSYIFRKPNSIGEYDIYIGFSNSKSSFSYYKGDMIEENDTSEFERYSYYQVKSVLRGKAFTSFMGSNFGTYTKDFLKFLYDFTVSEKICNQIESSSVCKDTGNKIRITQDAPQNRNATIGSIIREIKEHKKSYNKLLKNKKYINFSTDLESGIKNMINAKYYTRLPEIVDKYINNMVYSDTGEFISNLKFFEDNARSVKFTKVSKEELDRELSLDGGLYLFRLSNKDLDYAESYSKEKRKSRGVNNRDTERLLHLLTNGDQQEMNVSSCSVWFRPSSVKYTDKKMKEGFHKELKLTEKYGFPIIKNKRYTEDSIKLQLAYSLNYNTKRFSGVELNKDINSFCKDNKDVNILGIDRGERNLIYLSVINQKGDILLQKSLNIKTDILGKEYDYYENFKKESEKIQENKKEWDYSGNMKYKIDGYVSFAVKEVIDIIREYNCIISLENLSRSFRDNRNKKNDTIYTAFETSLISKLSDLSYKDIDKEAIGGHVNPFQLTENVKSKNETTQNGIVHYIDPWKTSKIDPSTGFSDEFYGGLNHKTIGKSSKLISCFDLKYHTDFEMFSFKFDYNDLKDENSEKSEYKTDWTIYTNGNRSYWDRKNKKYKKIDITDRLKELFHDNGIDYNDPNVDIKNEIIEKAGSSFYNTLLWVMRLTVSLRQYDNNDDYILSPVLNNGVFFDSRTTKIFPNNSDANGAYNIAIKALININKINQSEDGRINLKNVKRKEYLEFIINKNKNIKNIIKSVIESEPESVSRSENNKSDNFQTLNY